MSAKWLHLAPIAGALLGYAGSEAIGGNGFVAVWVAGLLYGWLLRRVVESEHDYAGFGEDLTGALVPASFFVFGATMLGPAIEAVSSEMVRYGLISLILIRPVATVLGLLGTSAGWRTTLFIGWFGPRGIASIIIVAVVIKEAGLAENDVIVSITTIAVALSVLLHGATAAPGAAWFAKSVGHERSKSSSHTA